MPIFNYQNEIIQILNPYHKLLKINDNTRNIDIFILFQFVNMTTQGNMWKLHYVCLVQHFKGFLISIAHIDNRQNNCFHFSILT
jgi:hypothetical protein